jgi:LemA protein
MTPSFAPLLILFVLLFFPLLWALGTYNGLVRTRNHCNESWSNIDTELKRRHNLIPNLVRTVEGYAQHERDLLKEVTEARNEARHIIKDAAGQSDKESLLAEKVEQLMVRVEAYPDLKADSQFQNLQQELIRTEDRIQHVRRIFNANVRDYNNRIEMFPSSFVASVGGFQPRSFFEVSGLHIREVPQIVDMSV